MTRFSRIYSRSIAAEIQMSNIKYTLFYQKYTIFISIDMHGGCIVECGCVSIYIYIYIYMVLLEATHEGVFLAIYTLRYDFPFLVITLLKNTFIKISCVF